MKAKTLLLASVLMLGIGIAVNAQTNTGEQSTIKLLPISENGMLRLMVVNPEDRSVRINFYDGGSLITKDKIHPSGYDKGFIRLYDFNQMKPGFYEIEVVSGGVKTSFELEVKADKKVWAKYWDKYVGKDQVVALRR